MKRRSRGFTTVELMITVVILGVLVMVALPSFQQQIRKGRRADAMAALANLQQAQERWRSTRTMYAPNSELTAGLGLSATSASGYYTIAINANSATGYTATATAASGTSQTGDTGCTSMSVRVDGGNLQYGAGGDWSDPKRCWVR